MYSITLVSGVLHNDLTFSNIWNDHHIYKGLLGNITILRTYVIWGNICSISCRGKSLLHIFGHFSFLKWFIISFWRMYGEKKKSQIKRPPQTQIRQVCQIGFLSFLSNKKLIYKMNKPFSKWNWIMQLKFWNVSNLNYFSWPLKSLKDITAAATPPPAFSFSVLFKEHRVKKKGNKKNPLKNLPYFRVHT